MRFKTDENLHPDVAVFLRGEGHDTLTVWDQGLRGQSDSSVVEVCRSENRAL
jgi:predicted nuclease of predicted toxin-antitoxin system